MILVYFEWIYYQVIMKIGFKLPNWFRKRRSSREEKNTRMGLTVTEDTPADMLAGSMELLVQLPRDHHNHTQRVTVERSTAMMDLLVQIATAHKLAASSYTLQAVGERGLVLPHQPNTPIGALDALEVKLLPKQGTLIPRKTKQPSQPFETTFRLQVHLPRNQLYVSRVSPKTNLGDILDQVCHEKNLNKDKYELRHPGNHKEVLDLSLSLQDYQLQEVTLYAKQGQNLGSALSSQDIIALQRQEERRRQQAKQGVFGFIFRKSKESSLSTESYGDRSVSPARSDETGRSVSPLAPPTRPQRKRRPAPNPPVRQTTEPPQKNNDVVKDESKEKLVISHSRNSSDSSGYHEASVLSDNPDSAGRMPETLPRRSRLPGKFESRKLAQTSQASKSLCNLAMSCGGLSHANSNTSLSSAGIRKKRAAPQPPVSRPLSAAISTQALERIVDSEESLTSDMGVSKPPSDIGGSSETEINSKANSDIAVDVHASTVSSESFHCITNKEDSNNKCNKIGNFNYEHSIVENMLPSDKSSQNLNKQSQNEKLSESSEETRQVDHARIAPRGNNRNQTETDHLLQKVSSTLATVLPTYEQNSWDANPSESRDLENINPVNLKNSTPHREETRFNDIPNSTLNSQQDTSDYVSANGEDLSGTDWEYQLPDPPSAFRDTINSDKDVCDTIMLHSVDAFKEPQVELEEKNCKTPTKEDNKSEKQKIECILEENSINKDNKISNTESLKTTSNPKQVQEKTDVELKKNIISELEAKIENGSLNQPSKNLELENRKTLIQTSTPRIAPVENTLPNFTITTYSRQKSLNIYDSPEKSALHLPDYSQDRIVKTFATLSRNVSSLSNNKGNYSSPSKINSPNDFINDNRKITRTQSIQNINSKGTADNDLRTKENNSSEEINHDNEVDNKNKSNAVHRSKSYIVLTNNLKYRENKPTSDVTDHEKMMKKSTSVTNLNQSNALVNETSQILQNGQKNLNISSQEKELQSVQVLKSILPQLKNTQLSEENTSNVFGNKTKIGEKILEKSNTQVHLNGGEEKNVISSKKKIEIEDTKRHRYTGPPSVSLGSWNERPCAHVQIKMDQDYKFGVKDNTSGAKTVVSLNSSSNNVDIMNFKDNYVKNLPKNRTSTVQNDNIPISNEIMPMIKRVTDNEVAKKVINTSISNKELGFNNLGFAKLRSASKDEDKPVVTNMELKKCYIDKPEFNDDDAKIDTRPVNFQELTQAFGQINLRTKSKYKNSQNRHSDYLDSRLNHDITDKNMAKTTGCKNSSESKNPIVKRYTSVIDIDNQHLTNGMKKNNTEKIPINSFNNYIPEMNRHSSTTTTVINKDFQIYSYKDTPKNANLSAKNNENKEIKLLVNNKINSHIPTPPSMPIITGVTLKSNNVRPKSMPVCNDPRDQLLESIRSFGRDKLRNVKIVS
ncbi:cordon-bleu protein-like 1 isoform X4 [Chelonus insularis]|uniref:cordon-bleu protein-like 1 isoform X4 n=1 Tax=Chelonus insularis TaxID=460826 RepID=UPI00158D0BC0|nr:cordon-bleu protein-like 1 isoform X4 [Chelonus insularis]